MRRSVLRSARDRNVTGRPLSRCRRFREALNATRDVWGEAAMAQPNGASYEFFAPLLPPPRYVNADFRALSDRAQCAARRR
jgi:hypothetical protein